LWFYSLFFMGRLILFILPELDMDACHPFAM